MIINYSKDKSYYTQRNNRKRPRSACNVTAATEACVLTGNAFNHPDGWQPEDYLMQILESDEARQHLDAIWPGAPAKAPFNPWNYSDTIAWAVNKAVGYEACTVRQVKLKDLLFHLFTSGIPVISGHFTRNGHFITIVGIETSQQDLESISTPDEIDISQIKHIIVDDPWGDYTTEYQSHNGNDVFLTLDTFKSMVIGEHTKRTAQLYFRSLA